MHNALELTSLKNLEQNQARFHPSLVKYLNKKDIFEKQRFSWQKSNVGNVGNVGEAIDSEDFCLSCSVLSDREIIYGDTYFSKKVAKLREAELVQDILWSLWEESRYNGTVIHAETIKVDLQLDKTSKPTKVKQFSLSFKISNLSNKKAQVFRSIDLDPYTQTEVNLLLSDAEVRTTPVAGGWHGLKYTSWNLFPKNTKWRVVKNVQIPKKETSIFNYDSLQLIYGESRFIPYAISRGEQRKTAVNSITADIIEKDIESWYGGYAAYLIRARIEDIKNLIDLLQKKTIENDKGVKESVFEQVLNNYQFRNHLYHHFRFNDEYKKVLNKLLTNEGDKLTNKDIRITIEEVIGLLKSWIYQLEQIQGSIKVEIIWHEKPKKVYSQAGQYGEFPTFSFNFEQKITWVKEMDLPLQGTWDPKANKYESSSGPSENGKYKFSLTNKLTNLKEILAPLTSTIGSLSSSLGNVNVMENLIPDVGKFIGIDSLKISKGESISYTYKTSGSPITLALDDIVDLREKHFPRMNIGWKAIDVSAGLSLANFTKLFYSLYEKFDSGIPNKPSLGFNQLTSAGEELKKNPISFIAHAINSIFDKSYGSGHVQRQDETKRPWPVFFRALFTDPLVFEHAQMMIGYSKLFFKYDDWWGKDNKQDEKCDGSPQSQSKGWCTSFDFSKKGSIITPVSDEVDLISRALTFNYSMYLPYSPIVLSGSMNGGQYEKFLGDNGVGKTSAGILNGSKEIIDVVKQEYLKNSTKFEGRKIIDWDKPKVSFAQLNLKKAIESVLALENTWSGFGVNLLVTSAGIYFHKILGDALVRDGFWINVNLMHEHGMFTKHDVQISKRMTYFPNSEIWLKVNPSLDHKKLNLGWLADSLVGKK